MPMSKHKELCSTCFNKKCQCRRCIATGVLGCSEMEYIGCAAKDDKDYCAGYSDANGINTKGKPTNE